MKRYLIDSMFVLAWVGFNVAALLYLSYEKESQVVICALNGCTILIGYFLKEIAHK